MHKGWVIIEHIYQKIEKEKLSFTKGFAKIAAYFQKHPRTIAHNSAARAGELIGVSETTIIRFAHQLGYSGYRDFQKDVQQRLFKKSSLSVYLDSKDIDQSSDQPVKNLIYSELKTIEEAVSSITEEKLERLVKALINADTIVTAGSQASHAFASWFAFALDLVKGKSHLHSPSVDNILLKASELSEDDVVVAFSFHRYSIDTLKFARLAKNEGAHVIGFTDSIISPITEIADDVLQIHLHTKSTLDVAPVVFTVLNSIVSTISMRRKELFEQRIKYFDSMKTEGLFMQSFLDFN